MALKAGRVGLDPKYVDNSGRPIINAELQRILTVADISGNPIDFKNAISGKAQDCKIFISPTQAGEGTPSPTNVREITGLSSLTVTASGGNISIPLGSTVYGGVLDVDSGVLTIDKVFIDDMSDITFTKNATYAHIFNGTLSTKAVGRTLDLICSAYQTTDSNSIISLDDSVAIDFSGDVIYFHDNDCTEVADVQTALSGVQLCYKIATPTIVQLTPQDLNLIQGNNSISVNGNTLISISYISVGL